MIRTGRTPVIMPQGRAGRRFRCRAGRRAVYRAQVRGPCAGQSRSIEAMRQRSTPAAAQGRRSGQGCGPTAATNVGGRLLQREIGPGQACAGEEDAGDMLGLITGGRAAQQDLHANAPLQPAQQVGVRTALLPEGGGFTVGRAARWWNPAAADWRPKRQAAPHGGRVSAVQVDPAAAAGKQRIAAEKAALHRR